MSGALVSILVGLAATNLGTISSEAPAYGIVMKVLLPVAVPFRAGKLLLSFSIGSGTARY